MFNACQNKKGHYPLLMATNTSMPSEIVLANSDKSVQLFDLNKECEIASFEEKDQHRAKIECIRYAQVKDRDSGNMMSTVLTASEDRFVKIWDRNSGKKACHLMYKNHPFFSVDTN